MSKTEQVSQNNQSAMSMDNAQKIVAVVWIDRNPAAWNETISSLLKVEGISAVYVGTAHQSFLREIKIKAPQIELFSELSLVEIARLGFSHKADQCFFVSSPMVAPTSTFQFSGPRMAQDPRIATISFLSNSAGYLSFPHRNTGTPFGVDGHNEETLTKLLRERKSKHHGLVPLPIADGPGVLVSRSAWEVAGEIDDKETGNLSFALAEFSLRANRRGFNSFLDPSTFITKPLEFGEMFSSVLENPEARHALHLLHPSFPGRHDDERNSANSVLAQALDGARAKATGLRVLIDGSALGPKEMGTQQLILQLATSLSKHPDIQLVALGVPDPLNLPKYAEELRHTNKVQLLPVSNLNFEGAPQVDIVHRPFQPTGEIPWGRWRSLSKRTVITIQDVIAYRNGAYFKNWDEWDAYRKNFKLQIANTDSVFCISRDVVKAVKEERLPVNEQNLFVVENGSDARSNDQPKRIPDAILNRVWSARSFVVVLGATYAHKNRDLALRVWARLRARGFDHAMVLVGASVPYGSSRNEEAIACPAHLQSDVLSLPEVGAEERNWLLQNASLVLYLTAAEGFGLVPFEAACLGVPTLHVSFGPLRELIDDSELPSSYDLDELYSRAELLLSDPMASNRSVQNVMKTLGKLTWKRTAEKTVDSYFETLSLPAKISDY
ncbi:glycosyltransferase [Rhizobium sp. AB2/73]|uniref:glycosyltransferase n=1 Tax=Rhizobium sp. AB2/73 TaxID=2795216 RepID=UPI001C5F909B|nr:glycosyltransferase [Rhizobium sp. AB2/73]QYA13660.1 glycosyltransferase [Rhizobium sp. AB2/73]UEQ80410.1 glycosyltransferase [Rhizobium sp. AB2/73]